MPSLAYNLDAWDGYAAERDALYEAVAAAGKRLVVLAGDTHNAWANRLVHKDQTLGIELATASVSSPGLESFLGLDSQEVVEATEFGLVQLIRDLFYTNLSDRGFLAITFTRERASAEWIYVYDVKRQNYRLLDGRYRKEEILVSD